MEKGNIGVFDSGLGGLWILKHLRETVPQYNYIFFGDQANVPYGIKTIEELFLCTTKALTYLYEKKDCACVILACNTTSSAIYSELQSWVQETYPGRKIFGIVNPTVEAIPTTDPIAVFATVRTVESHAFRNKIEKDQAITEIAMPELAVGIEYAQETQNYIASFAHSVPPNVRTGVLCCTHYGIVRQEFINAFPQITLWISQEEIIPKFFKDYLAKEKDFALTLSTSGAIEVYVTKENVVFDTWLSKWFGPDVCALTVIV